MKTLNINISEADFIKYNFQQDEISFAELVEKIQLVDVQVSKRKSKFLDTPAFNLWKDRVDMQDVDNYVATLRKPRQHNVY